MVGFPLSLQMHVPDLDAATSAHKSCDSQGMVTRAVVSQDWAPEAPSGAGTQPSGQ